MEQKKPFEDDILGRRVPSTHTVPLHGFCSASGLEGRTRVVFCLLRGPDDVEGKLVGLMTTLLVV